jgi:hypothetical protein
MEPKMEGGGVRGRLQSIAQSPACAPRQIGAGPGCARQDCTGDISRYPDRTSTAVEDRLREVAYVHCSAARLLVPFVFRVDSLVADEHE